MTATVASRRTSPVRALLAARVLLGLVAVSHVVVPIVMLARRASLESDIAARHPDFSAHDVAQSASVAIGAAVVFHALLAILCVVLIVLVPRGKRWVYRTAIVSQLASIGFGFVSWGQSTMFHAVVPVVDLLAVAVIGCVVVAMRSRPR